MQTNTREAVIILPQETNRGENLNRLLSKLQQELTETFGGCTILSGFGAWKAPSGQHQMEPVFLFTVAYEPDESRDAVLLGIANSYGSEAGQQSVYVRTTDGTVQFVTPHIEVEQHAPVAAGMIQSL